MRLAEVHNARSPSSLSALIAILGNPVIGDRDLTVNDDLLVLTSLPYITYGELI